MLLDVPAGAVLWRQRAREGAAGRTCAPTIGVEQSMSETKSVLALRDLASLLGRSPETIRKDLRRNPAAVPPRLRIEGTRLLRWRVADVDAWLAQRVEGLSHD